MASDRHDTHGGAQSHASPPPPPPAPKADPAAEKAAKEARAAGSIGAQIILDYNGDGSLGARGGLSASMEENAAGRDAHLISLGLDPVAPSGPPLSQEAVKAKQAAAEAHAKIDAQHATPGEGAASRVSSLAAGIITEPGDVPSGPGETVTGGRGH